MNFQIASVGPLRWGSGLGLIRLGSAEKTELGPGIKQRPGLRMVHTGAMVKGDFQIDTRKQ